MTSKISSLNPDGSYRTTEESLVLPQPAEPNSDIERALELIRKAGGGVAQLGGSSFFTFDVDGDDAVFDDDMRAKVEALLGEKVKAVVLPGLEGQLSIVPESYAQKPAPTPEASAMQRRGWEMTKRLHVAMSPITSTIFAGYVLKDGCTWGANKSDVTGEASAAVAQRAIAMGGTMTVTANGKPAYEITAREILAGDDKAVQP